MSDLRVLLAGVVILGFAMMGTGAAFRLRAAVAARVGRIESIPEDRREVVSKIERDARRWGPILERLGAIITMTGFVDEVERGSVLSRHAGSDDSLCILSIMRTVLYVAIAVILIVFGYLALFSIGWPFALTGILMLALIGQRHRIDVLAPALAWPWVFTTGYLLLAPIACTSTATATTGGPAVEGVTRCNSLFFTYAGRTPYEPPLLPAILTGAALATMVSLTIHWAVRRRQRADRRPIGSIRASAE